MIIVLFWYLCQIQKRLLSPCYVSGVLIHIAESYHFPSRAPIVRECLQTTESWGLRAGGRKQWTQRWFVRHQDKSKTKLFDFQQKWVMLQTQKYKLDCQDVLLISNPETKYAIMISSVSSISSGTVQCQGQQTDFWNVPCEMHSMRCTKYTFRETEMSFFKVTGASRRQIMCLTLWAQRQKKGWIHPVSKTICSQSRAAVCCCSKTIHILDLAKHGQIKRLRGQKYFGAFQQYVQDTLVFPHYNQPG